MVGKLAKDFRLVAHFDENARELELELKHNAVLSTCAMSAFRNTKVRKQTDPQRASLRTTKQSNCDYLINTAGDRGIEPGTLVSVNICDNRTKT